MASIQERQTKDGKKHWRAVVRRKGYPAQIATFPNKTKAIEWAQEIEVAIRNGKYFTTTSNKNHTVGEMIERYFDKVLSKDHPQYPTKVGHLGWWKKELGDYALSRITPSLLADCRDKLLLERIRKKPRTPATVNRYLASFSAVLTLAVREWEWLSENPMRKIKKLKEPNGRIRFLGSDEIERLLASCKRSSNPQLYLVVILALGTGMRQGEILNLTWSDLDFERRKAVLHKTKNHERRIVPVPSHIWPLLEKHKATQSKSTVFVFHSPDGKTPYKVRRSWECAVQRAGIHDFRFHDLRHTAASYLAMQKVPTQAIAAILGHKTLAMVKRYAHFADDHLASAVEQMGDHLFSGGRAL